MLISHIGALTFDTPIYAWVGAHAHAHTHSAGALRCKPALLIPWQKLKRTTASGSCVRWGHVLATFLLLTKHTTESCGRKGLFDSQLVGAFYHGGKSVLALAEGVTDTGHIVSKQSDRANLEL